MTDIEKALKIDGWMWESELQWLASMAEKSHAILELGSFFGRSTRALCDNTKGTVVAVDLWEQTEGGLVANFPEAESKFIENIKDHLITHKLFIYKCTTDVAIDILRKDCRKFDLIFIDADHRYEQVKKDILGCRELLTDGGIISGHDTTYEGVAKAVFEIFPENKVQTLASIWWIQ